MYANIFFYEHIFKEGRTQYKKKANTCYLAIIIFIAKRGSSLCILAFDEGALKVKRAMQNGYIKVERRRNAVASLAL